MLRTNFKEQTKWEAGNSFMVETWQRLLFFVTCVESLGGAFMNEPDSRQMAEITFLPAERLHCFYAHPAVQSHRIYIH